MRGWRRQLQSMPARAVYRALRAEMVGGIADRRYAAERRRHLPLLPPLAEPDRRAVTELERQGIHQTTLAALGLDPAAIVGPARQLAEAHRAYLRGRTAAGDDFVTVPPVAIQPTGLFASGLDARLLDLVETYLGLPCGYDGVTIQYTPADGRETATRLWHRDREDRRMVKVVVYCNDVDAAGGPLELIPAPLPRLPAGCGEYGPVGDAEVTALGLAARIACEGPSGTVVIADTARFLHRGRPPTGTDRVAVFFSYFARRPRHPFFCRRTGFSRRQVMEMTAHLPPRQRACALWRDGLAAAMRAIPVAPI